MSDPVIRRVRRSIDEAKNRGGMQVGMPKVTIDAADAERLCIVAEALATTQAENEALRAQLKETEEKGRVLMDMSRDLKARVAELERDVAELEYLDAEGREGAELAADEIMRLKAKLEELEALRAPIILRKQAEAVDEAREHMLRDAARGTGMNVDDANAWLKVKVQWLRDEAEQAGGEHG